MEVVWEKVIRPRIKTVVIEPVEFYWPGVEGGEWKKSEEEIWWLKCWRAKYEEEKRQGGREDELGQSRTKVLATLVKLLEEANASGLVTVGLAGALSRSPLLADDHLRQDQGSVGRIEAITRPLLVPLPLTPPTENTKLPNGDAEDGDRRGNNSLVLNSSYFSCRMQLLW